MTKIILGIIDNLKDAWRDREFFRSPIMDYDRALIVAIGTARAEAYTENQKLRTERAQRRDYPIELAIDAVRIRAERPPRNSCRHCHSTGRVGVAHYRVRGKQPINERAVIICRCVGLWVRDQIKPKVPDGS